MTPTPSPPASSSTTSGFTFSAAPSSAPPTTSASAAKNPLIPNYSTISQPNSAASATAAKHLSNKFSSPPPIANPRAREAICSRPIPKTISSPAKTVSASKAKSSPTSPSPPPASSPPTTRPPAFLPPCPPFTPHSASASIYNGNPP